MRNLGQNGLRATKNSGKKRDLQNQKSTSFSVSVPLPFTTFMERKKFVSTQTRNVQEHSYPVIICFSLRFTHSTTEELSDTFRTPAQTVSDTKLKLFPILLGCLTNFVKIPKWPPHFESGPLKGVFIIIDSTPTPIPKPKLSADRKLYYNFKKRPSAYAMKTQVAIGLDLTIWDVSQTYPHSVHDLTVFRQSAVPPLLSEEKKALGDSAYQGEVNIIVPVKKRRNRGLTQAQKLFNKQVAHVRISISISLRL
jgi:hypothetical protein